MNIINQHALSISFSALEEMSLFDCLRYVNPKLSRNKIKEHYSKIEQARVVGRNQSLSIPLDLANHHLVFPLYEGPTIEILYEDKNFLVIHKPSGVHGHPFLYSERETVINFVRQFRAPLHLINEPSFERGLLYRLDRETSGVLFYVKDQYLLDELREQFEETAKEKIYLALVEGECKISGSFKHLFTSSGLKGLRMKVFNHADRNKMNSKDPVFEGGLEVEPLKFNPQMNLTLVKVKLETGLRHQIRAQLAHLGFPLWGDSLYGSKRDEFAKGRKFYLHALQYTIKHRDISLKIECLPVDFPFLA